MISLYILICAYLNITWVNANIQIISPNQNTTLVPGVWSLVLEDDGLTPQIANMWETFGVIFYIGSNENPLWTQYSYSLNFTTNATSVLQTYSAELTASDLFNGIKSMFIGIVTFLNSQPNLLMITYSDRFSTANFSSAQSGTTTQATVQPAPTQIYRCSFQNFNTPGPTCAPSVAFSIANISTSTSSSIDPASATRFTTTAATSSSATSPTSFAAVISHPTTSAVASAIPVSTRSSQNSKIAEGLAGGLGGAVAISCIALLAFCYRTRWRRNPPRGRLSAKTWWWSRNSGPQSSELPTGAGPFETSELPAVALGQREFEVEVADRHGDGASLAIISHDTGVAEQQVVNISRQKDSGSDVVESV